VVPDAVHGVTGRVGDQPSCAVHEHAVRVGSEPCPSGSCVSSKPVMSASGRIAPQGEVSSRCSSNGVAASGVNGSKVVSMIPIRFTERAETPSGQSARLPAGRPSSAAVEAAESRPVTMRCGRWSWASAGAQTAEIEPCSRARRIRLPGWAGSRRRRPGRPPQSARPRCAPATAAVDCSARGFRRVFRSVATGGILHCYATSSVPTGASHTPPDAT
jgi:hypothetical protein